MPEPAALPSLRTSVPIRRSPRRRFLALVTGIALVLTALGGLVVVEARYGFEAAERLARLHTAGLALERLTLALGNAETAAPAAREAALAASHTAWQQFSLAFSALGAGLAADSTLHHDYAAFERQVASRIAVLAPPDPGPAPGRPPEDRPGEPAEPYRSASARLHAHTAAEAQQLTDAADIHRLRLEHYLQWLGGLLSGSALLALHLVRRRSADWQQRLRHLEYEATHDPLTQLPNRRLFTDCAVWGLAHALRCQRPACVLLLDLDGFKAVNDRYGHAAGDRLLIDIAARLQQCLRESDLLARLGGDEFAILIPSSCSIGDPDRLAVRLLQSIRTPQPDAAGRVPISASIGIACLPGHGEDIHTLLQAADTAMYAAKRAGGNAFRHAATPAESPPCERAADADSRTA